MHTIILGALMIGGTILVAVIGLILVRQRVSIEYLRKHHDVASAIIGVVGAIFAVLLAFVVFVVWSDYEDTKFTVVEEANDLGDLFFLSQGLPPELKTNIRKAIVRYAHSVIHDEWKTMAHRDPSVKTHRALADLWQIYLNINPVTEGEKVILAQSLAQLSGVSDSRRKRLHDCQTSIPTILWGLLWIGTVITITFTYFFGVESRFSQLLMTAALAGQVGFILFLVAALDLPFRGLVKIEPAPLAELLQRIEAYYPLK